MKPLDEWFAEHGIDEVEAIVPDMTGVARGKIMPAHKYRTEEGLRLPESIFLQTVTGRLPARRKGNSPGRDRHRVARRQQHDPTRTVDAGTHCAHYP